MSNKSVKNWTVYYLQYQAIKANNFETFSKEKKRLVKKVKNKCKTLCPWHCMVVILISRVYQLWIQVRTPNVKPEILVKKWRKLIGQNHWLGNIIHDSACQSQSTFMTGYLYWFQIRELLLQLSFSWLRSLAGLVTFLSVAELGQCSLSLVLVFVWMYDIPSIDCLLYFRSLSDPITTIHDVSWGDVLVLLLEDLWHFQVNNRSCFCCNHQFGR